MRIGIEVKYTSFSLPCLILDLDKPLKSRESFIFRLDSTYLGISNKRPANTRISVSSPKYDFFKYQYLYACDSNNIVILCFRLEFSFSYQQIPMIIRITALFLALKKKKLNIPEDFDSPSDGTQHSSPKASKEVRHRGSSTFDKTSVFLSQI